MAARSAVNKMRNRPRATFSGLRVRPEVRKDGDRKDLLPRERFAAGCDVPWAVQTIQNLLSFVDNADLIIHRPRSRSYSARGVIRPAATSVIPRSSEASASASSGGPSSSAAWRRSSSQRRASSVCSSGSSSTRWWSASWSCLEPLCLHFSSASVLKDLGALLGNHFETLGGDRKGQFNIRINGQWRVCFEWPEGAPVPSNIEIVDYH